jgi:general transcription factor 3C polypeptide 3 (transcription factor C subunit 4)
MQEASYNLARAAQHLGLAHVAVPLYERALRAAPPQQQAQQPGAADLRREAAHNLALIYRESGSNALARAVIREHLTV